MYMFALPPPTINLLLLHLLSATRPSLAAAAEPWPHNLPKHMKYFPEDEAVAKRSIHLHQKLRTEKPIGVKKMGVDAREMFLLENWIFEGDDDGQGLGEEKETEKSRRSSSAEYDYDEFTNATLQARMALRPIIPHPQQDWLARKHVRDVLTSLLLEGRQFQCPAGTSSCDDIGEPDVCCGTGSTCIDVSGNSEAGSVGCCPQGKTCAGGVRCDVASGYSSCPDAPNGGCCLPGFTCQGVGCVWEGTSTAYVQPSTSTPTSTSSDDAAETTSTSTTVVVVPTSPSTTTTTTPAPTSTSDSRYYTCSTGWFSCPSSLGGGCCMNGRTCATGASCLGDDDDDSTSTRAPDAPVRPTSGSVTTTTAAAPGGNDVCPKGFYVCSAYYPTGCCRVGLDCQTTGSCVLPTKTIVDTNGIVIVAPTGVSVAATQGGSCPSAWYSCAASLGGNCCPDGYACGEEQCTATASGQTGVEDKVTPDSRASFVSSLSIWAIGVSALGVGVAMVLL
ncbi:hypothetical protein BDW02DRAFT_564160 [Decorospora gaudefroyi]|uniref:GPI anchored protein n=1 Tax=Decorospora gaudefroyi TaxID=184978 RepID=A0A6A5KSI0_9PLEO|nr:hypothetical protein BDW02DRAFT_564160 [Decorospora gaudefroyi]